MPDLVDYLRDKLEHADDPQPFQLNGLLLYGSEPIRQDDDGNFTLSDEARAGPIFHRGLRDYWLHDRIGSRPFSFWLLPTKKRWWRRG
jgi:hypothetical protein